MKLTTENSMLVYLHHAVYMVAQLHPECGEKVDRVQAHQVAVSESNEYMLFAVFFVTDGEGAADLFTSEGRDGAISA
jgi:hypothetical protein